MIIYHGSTLIVEQPRIIVSEYGRDFGCAFYTTDIQAQAERWAVRKARIENRKPGKCAKPIVSVYEWDTTHPGLSMRQYDNPNLEWLDLVVRCRGDINYHHHYDIVCGKIADDNVGETISYVMQGVMRREDAVARLKFEKINNQIAFCTKKALGALTFLESYEVTK